MRIQLSRGPRGRVWMIEQIDSGSKRCARKITAKKKRADLGPPEFSIFFHSNEKINEEKGEKNRRILGEKKNIFFFLFLNFLIYGKWKK